MKTNKILYALALLLIFNGCSGIDKFLGEAPRKQSGLEIKTLEHLNGLIVGADYHTSNHTFLNATDLCGNTPEHYLDAVWYVSYVDAMNYVWDIEQLSNNTNYTPAWSYCYGRIFVANTVLDYISKVTGDQTEKDNLKAEAHYLRAFSNMELLDTYCMPYSAENLDEPGLPRKSSTNFEQSLVRMSLRDTYKFVEDDLMEALKTKQTDLSRSWRVSLTAVQALTARFYLNIGNYTEALRYANLALAAKSTLVDYNTEITPAPEQTSSGVIDYTNLYMYWRNEKVKIYNWKEFYHFATLSGFWIAPSQSMLDKYDQANDMRYEHLIVENLAYYFGVSNTDTKGYMYFGMSNIPFGPTVQEMILIKAECEARAGNWQQAMATLVPLRNARMRPGTPALTATSKDDAILKIADERLRELTYATRWADIRRYNNNETTIDDVSLSHTFYDYNEIEILTTSTPKVYTLSGKSRRFAVPIPTSEINLSDGQLVQNKY